MTNKFSQLRARMSPEAQARSEAKAKVMLEEMPLNELRQARGLSQKNERFALRSAASHCQAGKAD